MKRLSYLVAAGLLMASVVGVAPVNAQGRSQGCTSSNVGAPTTGGPQNNSNPSNSRDVLVGLVDVLVQDVNALNNINAQVDNVANNLSVVCLNDVLNQNDVHVLQDILNGSPILNNNLNNSLNGNNVLTGFLNNNNILGGAQIVAVNLNTGAIYVL